MKAQVPGDSQGPYPLPWGFGLGFSGAGSWFDFLEVSNMDLDIRSSIRFSCLTSWRGAGLLVPGRWKAETGDMGSAINSAFAAPPAAWQWRPSSERFFSVGLGLRQDYLQPQIEVLALLSSHPPQVPGSQRLRCGALALSCRVVVVPVPWGGLQPQSCTLPPAPLPPRAPVDPSSCLSHAAPPLA